MTGRRKKWDARAPSANVESLARCSDPSAAFWEGHPSIAKSAPRGASPQYEAFSAALYAASVAFPERWTRPTLVAALDYVGTVDPAGVVELLDRLEREISALR
jgi:hypothetical protein